MLPMSWGNSSNNGALNPIVANDGGQVPLGLVAYTQEMVREAKTSVWSHGTE